MKLPMAWCKSSFTRQKTRGRINSARLFRYLDTIADIYHTFFHAEEEITKRNISDSDRALIKILLSNHATSNFFLASDFTQKSSQRSYISSPIDAISFLRRVIATDAFKGKERKPRASLGLSRFSFARGGENDQCATSRAEEQATILFLIIAPLLSYHFEISTRKEAFT